ncbi:MAG: hypothetical protein D6715_03880 [Calditrichaeota bacterium]|nr:MAG: hypothetical protein D6715_03880 [Calditrichota bacterium]
MLQVVLLVGFLPAGEAGRVIDPTQEDVAAAIREGMELTVRNRFEQADSLFHRLIQKYPDQPFGYFYVAANLQAWMLDEEDFSRSGLFQLYLNRVLVRCDSLEKIDPNNGWLAFYRGSAHLYKGFLNSKLGHWWGAYREARKGVKELERVLAKDSTLYDALLGIGSYKYWKSAKSGVLRFLPLIADEREEGLRLVEKAIERGHFVYWVGRDQLAWMLIDSKQWERALALAKENHQQIPESRFFLWTLSEALARSGKYREALPVYRQLLESIRADGPKNHFNELHCLTKMAEINLALSRYREADSLARAGLALPLRSAVSRRAKGRLKKLRKVLKVCAPFLAGRQKNAPVEEASVLPER